jgi:hypothetical protein
MELTYNQIIKVLNDFATNHYQINQFGNGDLWEVVEHNQTKDFNYPLLWVQDQPHSTTQGEIEMTFRCFFINLVQKDESNENEVKSDMYQCATDLLSYWYKQTDYRTVSVDINTTLTSFTERFNDELTGWWIDIKLTQQFRYDKCSIPMDGITPIPNNCLPATITINGESFTTAASGGIENILVKDDNGLTVGSKVGAEWIVPAAGGDPVANSMNGDPLTDAVAGTTKTFVIQDSGGSPVTVTEVSDSATAFVGEVPDGVGDIYYNMPQPIWDIVYNTWDEGDHNQKGTYDNTVPSNGRVQVLENGNFYKVQFDKENRGHTYRFLGLNGGYYNSDDGNYYDSNDVLSDVATVFDADDYAFDRLTGLGWRIIRSASQNLVDAITTAEAATWNTFTNWHIPFLRQTESIVDLTGTLPLYRSSSPIFNFAIQSKTVTPYAGNPTTQGWEVGIVGSSEPARGYTSTGAVYFVRDARGQF